MNNMQKGGETLLGDYVEGLCKERGTSIYQMEKDLGIGNGTVKRWNASTPSLRNLIKVADYLGVEPLDLIEQKRETE